MKRALIACLLTLVIFALVALLLLAGQRGA